MDDAPERREPLTRLVCCVAAALVLCSAADKYAPKLSHPALERCLPWLRENKVQAIAILAAVLYILSLALFPAEEEPSCPDSTEGTGGYEPVC